MCFMTQTEPRVFLEIPEVTVQAEFLKGHRFEACHERYNSVPRPLYVSFFLSEHCTYGETDKTQTLAYTES